jgi:hypothetical protein
MGIPDLTDTANPGASYSREAVAKATPPKSIRGSRPASGPGDDL